MADARWPELPLAGWQDTYDTLHLWSQVLGKIALGHADPLNHSWGVALQVAPRGLTTRLLHHGARDFTLELDFVDHRLVVRTTEGEARDRPLHAEPVADFYHGVTALLAEMGLPVEIWPVAVELPTPIRLDEDVEHRSYDRAAVERFWRVLRSAHRVLSGTRCEFVGKSSPVHFFWGAFDLAVTRFNGRPAPPREGPAFMREAYSHEVISHGFWPGSAPVLEPAFYAYAAPVPASLKDARVRPDAAYWHAELGEFILPYDAVRRAASPEAVVRDFVHSTYDAAAAAAGWDRAALDRRPLAL